MFLQCPHQGAVNAINTSLVGSITTDSKLSMSAVMIADGGGGLMLDLTPDLVVTLEMARQHLPLT